ncbi:(2Fe-2S)-binding protein, partial [Streptomyces sp. NPDC057927]
MRVNFTVNGRPQEADDVWEGESLLYVLRERLGLPGSKNACEQGECGSCTVRLDGVPVCSCLVAAGQVEGREVVTVEGLAEFAKQRAEHGGCATGSCGTSLDEARRWESNINESHTGDGVLVCSFLL